MKDNTAEIANLERVLDELESEHEGAREKMGAIEYEMAEVKGLINELKGDC